MAHLVVYKETVIENEPPSKENKVLSIGKHPRDSGHEGKQFGAIGSKRRALGSITNTFSQHGVASTTIHAHQTKCTVSSSLGGLLLEPTLCSTSSTVSASRGRKSIDSSSSSFSMSTSLLSMGSPGSPMVFSPGPKEEVINIDQLNDPVLKGTGEYAQDIFSYLREAEVRFQPKADYIKKQPDITHAMRCILVDWLVEVCEEFKLEQQTLYLGVAIVDRFLSVMSVMRSKLQLLGASSMFLAAKFEEIYPPEVGDFVYITDDTYTKLQIARMEAVVLKALGYNLMSPTCHTFLQRYMKAAEISEKAPVAELYGIPVPSFCENMFQHCSALAMYLCELAMMNGEPYLKYRPSVIAASSLCLARHTLQQQAWTKCLQHYSGYSVSDISNCVQDLHRTFAMAPAHPQQAIRHKYNSDKYFMVASVKVPETLPC